MGPFVGRMSLRRIRLAREDMGRCHVTALQRFPLRPSAHGLGGRPKRYDGGRLGIVTFLSALKGDGGDEMLEAWFRLSLPDGGLS